MSAVTADCYKYKHLTMGGDDDKSGVEHQFHHSARTPDTSSVSASESEEFVTDSSDEVLDDDGMDTRPLLVVEVDDNAESNKSLSFVSSAMKDSPRRRRGKKNGAKRIIRSSSSSACNICCSWLLINTAFLLAIFGACYIIPFFTDSSTSSISGDDNAVVSSCEGNKGDQTGNCDGYMEPTTSDEIMLLEDMLHMPATGGECKLTWEDTVINHLMTNDTSIKYCDSELRRKFIKAKRRSSTPCRCHNPLIGQRLHHSINEASWTYAFHETQKRVNKSLSLPNPLDVAFVGDSIMEHWTGLTKGKPDKRFSDVPQVYQQLFTREGGGQIDGTVLGMGGQRCRNTLYQFQNGTMFTEHFKPKIFWILVGTNDLNLDYCTVYSIVAGIVAIVDEIRRQRPESIVVVNGLLPNHNQAMDGRIKEINKQLSCFVQNYNGRIRYTTSNEDEDNHSTTGDDDDENGKKILHYFDATPHFKKHDGKLYTDRMVDTVHPNAKGYKIWGDAMAQKILNILQQQQQVQDDSQ